MIVLILERVPVGLRGELTRWLLEPKTGVFVGKVSAMVRDLLWEKACGAARGGSAVLLYASDTEQGFAVRQWNTSGRTIVDFEGLSLVQIH